MNQESAFDLLKTGHNVFITGAAGTGKTYLLNRYITYLKERKVTPAVVAPTGIAASHLKGETIHSFFALGIRENVEQSYITSLMHKPHLLKRFSSLQILIIDEISMVSPELLSSIDRIVRAFKVPDQPFGGIQIIVSGDFFQLPPVSATPREKRFAWQSESWRDAGFHTCYMEAKYRQKRDTLVEVLDAIRNGQVTDTIRRRLYERQYNSDETHHQTTRLYTHNADVERINREMLSRLSTPPRHYSCITKGSGRDIDRILHTSLVTEKLTLKKGAMVIFIKNDADKRYVNGTTGVVTGFDSDGSPVVTTAQGRKLTVTPQVWSLTNERDEIVATLTQIPLRLAWAITIHKSQGMTLDTAEIDLSRTFETGQGYVALSRIKSIEGLRLLGINETALSVDPLILKVDKRIKEASIKASVTLSQLSDRERQKREEQHLLTNGGTIDPDEIEQQRTLLATEKFAYREKKIPTHRQTKALIEKATTLRELADLRGMTIGTIVSHLTKLKEEDEKIDLHKFKSSAAHLTVIQQAIESVQALNDPEHLSQDGRLRLKPIFDQLNGEVGYDEIKLALLFL